MRKLLMFLTLLCTFVYSGVFAQNRTVSGKVTSKDDGTGLPGVTVKVKSTTIGTQTDIEGNYKLEVPADSKTLEFSFVGYATQTIEIGNQSVIDVKLATDDKVLNEVIVVGYGEQSKKTLTSSITKISGNSIANLATPSFDQQLAGRASGVQVTLPSGIIGQAPVIRVRGTNTITGSSSPLIVIDNVPVITGNQSTTTNSNPLGDINPADIESYEVLKDGAATAIYGSRAASGVILITTKRGKKNSPARVDFSTYVGVTSTVKRFDLLSSADFVTISNEKAANTSATPNPNNIVARGTGLNTNWQDQIFRTGVTQNYNLNFSGGVEKTSYFFSIGYTNQEGVAVANDMKRLSVRGNIDHNFNKWIEGGSSFSYTRSEINGLNIGQNSLSGNVFNALRALPNIPVFNAGHPTGYNVDSLSTRAMGRWTNPNSIANDIPNIRFSLDNNINRNNTDRIISNSYLTLKIPYVDGLKFKTAYSLDLAGTRDFFSWDPRHGDGNGSGGRIGQTSRLVSRWNWQNTVSYNKEIGDHTIGFVAGVEYQKTTLSSFTGSGIAFSDRFFLQEGLISDSYTTQLSSGTYDLSGFASTFFRANYGFKNKYLASFTYRRDGISDMPTANRFGNFLGGSLGYRVSEEAFYQNSSIAKIMNEVKVRASYAQVGNVDLNTSFPYLGLFGASQYASFNGIAFSQPGNPNLRWESSAKIDIGLELGFFNNRLNFEADYFVNDITDLVLQAPVASSLGIPNPRTIGNTIASNIGAMRNTGLEIVISGDVLRLDNGFKWNAAVNFTSIKNEVLSLVKNSEGKDQDVFITTGTNGNYHIIRPGNPVASFYGYTWGGVSPERGNPMYVKGNGRIVERDARTGQYSFYTPGGAFAADNAAALLSGDVSAGGDRSILASAIPTWYGGLTNNFSWKGFDLEVFLRFSGGNSIMNVTRQESLLSMEFNNNGQEIMNRWTTPGQQTDVPRVVLGTAAQNVINLTGVASTRFIEKGDFLRIQNVVLGYTLPSSLLAKTKEKSFALRSVRVYAQVQNLATFSAYKGLDPEITTNTAAGLSSNAGIGVDFNTNPIMRTITFGLNIGL
jgi:TonB-linked SusC/RagA family outer membrane protein